MGRQAEVVVELAKELGLLKGAVEAHRCPHFVGGLPSFFGFVEEALKRNALPS